jgi:uncharacterized protein YcnI
VNLLSITRARRGAGAIVAAAIALTCPAAVASAHIQVAPKVVAPDDPVKFTVLIPGERQAQTTRVDLKMPSGLLPFSYEDTPGWTRHLVKASNGGVDHISWTGHLAHDGFVEFSFLAGTPEQPGQLVWKAVQTYSDGTIVRWIGAPNSEQPAPVTQVVAGAPRQNAGGEGASATPASAAATEATVTSSASRPSSAFAGSRSGRADWVARGLAAVALLALVALATIARRSERRMSPSDDAKRSQER